MNHEIWDKYQKGINHHNQIALVSNTDKAYNFYEDRQWEGCETGGEALPFFNVIKPIVKFKTASIAMNDMSIIYSANDGDEKTSKVCEMFNEYAKTQWEKLKMEKVNWELIKAGMIAGDAYAYFYNEGNSVSIVNNTDIHFADETTNDIQSQKYIIIAERLFVEDVKEAARANNISEDVIANILPDEATNKSKHLIEVKGTDKVTSLLYMWKEEGIVHFCRTTRDVVYQPREKQERATHYPIAGFVVEKLKDSARGLGEVRPLIANQIAINRNLIRRSESIAHTAFPKIVYDRNMIDDVDELEKVGSKIAVEGTGANNVNQMVGYLNPSAISPDAKIYGDELLATTKELAGAGDAALGQINPEQASGTAIIAVRDQATIPLNESVAAYRQYVEDVANVWISMWCTFNPDGLKVLTEVQEEQVEVDVPTEDVKDLNVKVDVSPNNPFSRYAQNQGIENLLAAGHIQFEEFVELLDDYSVLPVNKLKELIQKRGEMNAMQQVPNGEANSGIQERFQGGPAFQGVDLPMY